MVYVKDINRHIPKEISRLEEEEKEEEELKVSRFEQQQQQHRQQKQQLQKHSEQKRSFLFVTRVNKRKSMKRLSL